MDFQTLAGFTNFRLTKNGQCFAHDCTRWNFISYQFETYPWKAKSISNRSNWTCLICNTSFKLKKQLIEHEKAQHQVTQPNTYAYQCKVCAKSFRRPYLLREHEQVHEKKILFRCQLCPAKYRYVLVRFFRDFQLFYSSSSNLRRHIKSKHEQSNCLNSKSNDTVPLQPNQKPTVKYICELCGKVLKSRYR